MSRSSVNVPSSSEEGSGRNITLQARVRSVIIDFVMGDVDDSDDHLISVSKIFIL
jgi:hypothetical protein